MPDVAQWSAFLSATIVLLLIPGPTVMYVLARGIGDGHRAVLLSAVGLALGDLLQVLLTVAGFSALLAMSDRLYATIKFAGAAYLIVLGLTRLAATAAPRPAVDTSGHSALQPSGSIVLQGFLALNPKTALFFLALFPQWIDPGAGPAWSQMLWFGAAFVALGLVSNSLYGLLGAGTLRSVLLRSPRAQRMSQVASGGVLVVLGLLAALAPSPASPAPSQ